MSLRVFLAGLMLSAGALAQEAPAPEATPEPLPSLVLALLTKDPKAKELLTAHPELANEKSSARLQGSEDDPKNLRGLAACDTGLNPLHVAAARGDKDFVRALLEAKAQRDGQTARYKSRPEELAIENGHFEVARLLMNAPPTAEDYFVEVDLRTQQLRVYEKGAEIRTDEISSGKKSKPSQTGWFLLTQKDRHHRSSLYNNAPMPWFSRLSWTAAGIHQGYLPGRPASHGCIRTTWKTAEFIFKTCPKGTLVHVK